MSCFDLTHAPVATTARAATTGPVSMSTRPDPEGSDTVEIARLVDSHRTVTRFVLTLRQSVREMKHRPGVDQDQKIMHSFLGTVQYATAAAVPECGLGERGEMKLREQESLVHYGRKAWGILTTTMTIL